MHEDDNPFSLKAILIVLIVGAIVYWLFKSPSKKVTTPSFVYNYVVDEDSLQKGKQFVITSLDTCYGNKEDGSPNVIEVKLSTY